VLDSSVLVAAERPQLPGSILLGRVEKQHNVTEIVLSAISVVELEHGIYRARSPQQAARRPAISCGPPCLQPTLSETLCPGSYLT
jgi:predicted nucleic acid-binding protein